MNRYVLRYTVYRSSPRHPGRWSRARVATTPVRSLVHVLLQKPAGASASSPRLGCTLPTAQAQLALAGTLPCYFPGSSLAAQHTPRSSHLLKISSSTLTKQTEQNKSVATWNQESQVSGKVVVMEQDQSNATKSIPKSKPDHPVIAYQV